MATLVEPAGTMRVCGGGTPRGSCSFSARRRARSANARSHSSLAWLGSSLAAAPSLEADEGGASRDEEGAPHTGAAGAGCSPARCSAPPG
eukprot:scaffold8984_cov58-Phaeocystis_antarctica.AAC.1